MPLQESAEKLSAATTDEDFLNYLAFYHRELRIPNALSLERDIEQNPSYNCIVVLNLLDLRKINNVYGRAAGDALLKEIRDYILALNIDNATLYRMEQGDFGLLFSGLPVDDGSPVRLAEQIHKRFESSWSVPLGERRQDIFATATLAVVPLTSGYEDAPARMYAAVEYALDIALGSGGVAVYNDHAHEEFHTSMKMELGLKKAVRNHMEGFYVDYQPIVEPGVALWSGMEALCRWDSPEFGLVSPVDFIPLAESCGLIDAIGLWVLEQAIIQVKQWGLDAVERFILEVNLSPVQLAAANLDTKVMSILSKHNYPPSKLCLEVTESSELNFSRHTLAAIERLSELGVVIALDDFGTGYASFSTLHKLPVSVLKIDRSLVLGIESDNYLQHLFYVLVELAHVAGMKVVTEGVETNPQLQCVMQKGADYFQGNYFSLPLTVKQMEENLHHFHTPPECLSAMSYGKLDLSWISDGQGGYEMTPALSRLLNRCMRELFHNPDSDSAINTALMHIGQGLKVSRSYVFLREPDGTFTNTHEWCAPGVAPEKHNLQHVPIAKISPQWLEALYRSGFLAAADINTLDEQTYEELERQGIKAVVEFPIWRDNDLFGFVGFDECFAVRYWTREEVQMLYILTGLIAATISRKQLQGEITAQNQRQENILNNMDTVIVVSDLDTDKVLFANSGLKRLYGRDPSGCVCWEALRYRHERCENCPVPFLRKNPQQVYQREYYNDVLKRHFRVRDSVIPWEGGRLAHLEYAEDISELKDSQKKLEVFASTDMLTGALNRLSMIEAAKDAVERAMAENLPVTLAFIDIDCLKQENDTYGHGAGDKLICDVVSKIKANTRASDIIGRYGGDEFIIVFNKCIKANAKKRLRNALADLQSAEGDTEHVAPGFSFGLVETSELTFTNVDDYVKQMIDVADQRMFEHKKQRKIGVRKMRQER